MRSRRRRRRIAAITNRFPPEGPGVVDIEDRRVFGWSTAIFADAVDVKVRILTEEGRERLCMCVCK